MVTHVIGPYSEILILENQGRINHFNEELKKLGNDGYGFGYYLNLVKDWNISLILSLALSDNVGAISSYILADNQTIYPMCLVFICRSILNSKSVAEIDSALIHIESETTKWWNKTDNTVDLSILGRYPVPSFTPKCYLDLDYLNFPSQGGHLSPIKNTLFAWFGMINPNSLGGLLETKKILKPILIRESVFENLRVLSGTEGSDKIIIRRNYYPGIDLTMKSVAELLLRERD